MEESEKRCPDRMFGHYHGDYPLLPIFAPFLNHGIELAYKAKLDVVTDILAEVFMGILYWPELERKMKYGSIQNLKELFGLPVSVLRKIRKDALYSQEDHSRLRKPSKVFTILNVLYETYPGFLEVEAFHAGFFAYFEMLTESYQDYGYFVYMEIEDGEKEVVFLLPGQGWNSIRRVPQGNIRHFMSLIRYINTLSPEDIRIYRDYINLCGQIGEFPRGRFPGNVKRAHDEALEIHFRRVRDHRVQLFRTDVETDMEEVLREKRFLKALLRENYAMLATDKEEEDALQKESFVMLQPVSVKDMERESAEMHNCVRTYVDAVSYGKSWILFMRRRERPERAYITVEVTPHREIVQAKAFGNSRPDSEACQYLHKWADVKHLRIATSDIAKLPA